jgi:MFS family permease
MLAMLTAVGACSMIDRTILSTLLEPIKREFALKDAQLGLVAGLGFAVAHALVAVPLGRLADRVNRRNLIAACLLFWTLMTALCGMAGGFVSLLLARMGVGAGEAGGQAASLSTVSDLYPERRRATAVSVYYLSSPIGVMLAGSVGGIVAAAHGWRAALFVAAVPGAAMAVLLPLLGREPPREGVAARPAGTVVPFGEVLAFIRSQRALMHLLAGLAVLSFTLSGLGAFAFSFFIRYHHMSLKVLGPIIGLTSGAVGIVVLLASGMTADRLALRDARWRLWMLAVTVAVVTPFVVASFLVSGPAALPLYLMNLILMNVWTGPALATSQSLTPAPMRGTVAAIVFVIIGFLGFGLGPLIVGALSDALVPVSGHDSLRWSLILAASLNFWGACHLMLATRTLREDLARVQAESDLAVDGRRASPHDGVGGARRAGKAKSPWSGAAANVASPGPRGGLNRP